MPALVAHTPSGPYRAMSSSTRRRWPQVAAACNGVQHSLSRALTRAPASRSCCTISRKSSMQLCGARSLSVRAHTVAPASPPTASRADLMQGCQAVLIGQVRADPALEELADCGEDRGGQGSGAEVGCRPVSPAQAPAQGTWVTCCAVARTAEEHREGRRDPRAQAEGSGLGPQAGYRQTAAPCLSLNLRMPSQLGPSSLPTPPRRGPPGLGAGMYPQIPLGQVPCSPSLTRSHTHTHPSPGTCSPLPAPRWPRLKAQGTQAQPSPAAPPAPQLLFAG